MDGGSWHCTGGSDQDHPQGKKMQKGKMAVWGRLTNSCEKKRSKRKMRKEKMWELDYKESWVPKNWCFLTMVLEKTLESPLDCKEIQPVILKEISPEYSLEGLMLKLKLWYFVHLMPRTDSLEKTLMLGNIEGGWEEDHRGWDGWLASLTWWA